jgi:DNA repair exonuclease SbcCD ATPase subunit
VAAEQARAGREADAVKLLASLFGEKKRDVESQFVEPLTDRVSGYLERLYGDGTTVSVVYRAGRFSQLTVSRPNARDLTLEFGQLSSGAKEEVSAAIRLAMAEILAEAYEGCLPVVFDDAFVNSDTDRQRALQQMLDLAASRGLQAIVLACLPEGYAGLGARMIRLADKRFAAWDADTPST